MKLNEMFPSSLLKAADVESAGGEMDLIIFSIEKKEFDNDDGKQTKPVITFTNDAKMVCNKTNANTLAEMYGDDSDMWINKPVTLIVESVEYAGKKVPGIRIKNVNSRDALIQSYWTKSREVGLTREEGLAHLKEFGGDFSKALAGLNG